MLACTFMQRFAHAKATCSGNFVLVKPSDGDLMQFVLDGLVTHSLFSCLLDVHDIFYLTFVSHICCLAHGRLKTPKSWSCVLALHFEFVPFLLI